MLEQRAFSLEYLPNIADQELRDDIFSYLGEYRLNVQKYSYQLRFSTGQDGLRLRDVYGGEALRSKALRTIEKRELLGEPTTREQAELWGIASLEDQLRFAQTGDTIIWASPPGPKEEGYGNYGFIYVGNVLRNGQTVHLSMTAIRVEKPTIAEFNQAFTALSGIQTDFNSAEDFLQTPRVVGRESDPNMIEKILRRYFFFEKNNTENVFQKVISKLRPMIDELISLVKSPSTSLRVTEEKLRAFYALENYTLELKRCYQYDWPANISHVDDYRYYQLYDIMRIHGHEPTQVSGSCGPSGKTRSNGLLNRNFELLRRAIFDLEDDDFGSRQFDCPDCKETNVRPYNQLLSACQHCGSKNVAC